MQQGEAGEGGWRGVPIGGRARGDPIHGVAAVDLVQMEAPGVAPGKAHVDQPAQHRRAVDARHMWLEYEVDRRLRHRGGQRGERLHHLLGQGIKSAERLAHKCLDHLLGQQVVGVGQHFFKGGAAIGGEDRSESLQRPRVALSALTGGSEQRVGRIAQAELSLRVLRAQDLLRKGRGRYPSSARERWRPARGAAARGARPGW